MEILPFTPANRKPVPVHDVLVRRCVRDVESYGNALFEPQPWAGYLRAVRDDVDGNNLIEWIAGCCDSAQTMGERWSTTSLRQN